MDHHFQQYILYVRLNPTIFFILRSLIPILVLIINNFIIHYNYLYYDINIQYGILRWT